MTSRPPKDVSPIEAELWAERASTMSRMTERFETALESYKRFALAWDATPEATRTSQQKAAHEDLELAASEALWHLVVQREAIGLRGHADLMQLYAVPINIRRKMGPRRPKTEPPQKA